MARGYKYFEAIEKNAVLLGVLTLVAVSFGGLSEITPLFIQAHAVGPPPGVKPYDALRLAGKDIYVREGCYLCHSQMIRALRAETQRYGPASTASESVYDRPFQWGSKRTGPDLARIGGKYPNVWHLRHMEDPRGISAGSNMPSYPWLSTHHLDASTLPAKIKVQRTLGVPYGPLSAQQIFDSVDDQAKGVAKDLRAAGAYVAADQEIVALIAYLQTLGKSQPVTSKVLTLTP